MPVAFLRALCVLCGSLFSDRAAAAQQVASGVYRPDANGRVVAGVTTDLARLDVQAGTVSDGTRVAIMGDDESVVIVTKGRMVASAGGRTPTSLGPGSVALRMPGDSAVLIAVGGPAAFHVLRYEAKAAPNAARGAAAGGSATSNRDSVAFAPSATGGRRQPFDRPTTMYGRFEMHVSTLNEGLTNHAVHTHRAEEFVLILRGDVRMTVGDRKVTAGPGDLVFLASNVPHALDNVGRGPAEYFAFQGIP